MKDIAPAAVVAMCAICKKPASLETAKTNERGQIVHEECYLQKMKLKAVEVVETPKPVRP